MCNKTEVFKKFAGRGCRKEAARQKEVQEFKRQAEQSLIRRYSNGFEAHWYINDYHQFLCAEACNEPEPLQTSVRSILRLLTGHEPYDVYWGYTDTVSEAIRCLLCIGIIYKKKVYANPEWEYLLFRARENIQKRIKEIDKTLKK